MNFFKNKRQKIKAEPQPVPREMVEINKTYGQLCAQAGQVEISLRLKKRDLENIYLALENVNAEANARQKLDEEAKLAEAKLEPKKEETTDGQ